MSKKRNEPNFGIPKGGFTPMDSIELQGAFWGRLASGKNMPKWMRAISLLIIIFFNLIGMFLIYISFNIYNSENDILSLIFNFITGIGLFLFTSLILKNRFKK
ncbi:MAG TPA: hypothetical protein DEA43_02180 [Candidatus Moranbacteria bacterium]|nr:hypothetical protein [Candidatus Moranbacteria bacterium]HBT45672.1 hypothetical protein [Candidatus Moranbacteria bacterium]